MKNVSVIYVFMNVFLPFKVSEFSFIPLRIDTYYQLINICSFHISLTLPSVYMYISSHYYEYFVCLFRVTGCITTDRA